MRGALAAAPCVALAACSSTPIFQWERQPGSYDRLGGAALSSLGRARQAADQGDSERAKTLVTEVFGDHPDNIAVGAFLQELQIELLVDADPPGGDGRTPTARRRALARLWRQRASDEPTVAHLVLAARIEDDGPAAEVLLEEALAADPSCSWAHLGLAHLAALEGRWNEAAEHIGRALRADPGHPQARRFQASVLARAGSLERATGALEHWLEEVGTDPRVAPELVASARLDLAELWIERGDAKRAREVLEAPGGARLDPVRRLLLTAAIEQASGRPDRALAAATEAEELAPADPLPLEQQALLADQWLDDPALAREAWLRLQARAADNPDLSSRLRVMRAQIELERLAAEDRAPAQRGTPPAQEGG